MNASRLPCVRRALRPGCIALALCLLACHLACHESPAPDAGWPAGALLVAERAALQELATRASRLTGTPLAEAARALSRALPKCPWVEALAPGGRLEELVDSLRCHSPDGDLAALASERAQSNLVFALPVEDAGRAIGRARVDAGELVLDLEWNPGERPGPLDLLLPGDSPAGAAQLDTADALVHLRVRPQRGIDLSRLIAADSQASQLFQLRAALFTSAILDGAWEAAVYLPPDGGEMPRVAVALDVRSRSAARSAAEAFLEQIRSTWKLAPEPFALAGGTGSCLPELRLLPELAPCYVATETSLVLGWNPESLHHALEGASTQPVTDPGHVELDLALFAEADALLSRHVGPNRRPSSLRWPWRRAVASARREADGPLRVRVELRGALGT